MSVRDYFIGYVVAMLGYEIGFLRTLRSYFTGAEQPPAAKRTGSDIS